MLVAMMVLKTDFDNGILGGAEKGKGELVFGRNLHGDNY